MCGVIVVDAGKSGLLILDVMPIYMIIAYNIVIIIWFFYQLPNSNLFTLHMLFSWEKPLVKSTTPGLFPIIFFQIYYSKNPKIPCCTFCLFFCAFIKSIYQTSYDLIYFNTAEGLTTPLTCWVASICCLCVCAVYIVLLGSPTRLITMVS